MKVEIELCEQDPYTLQITYDVTVGNKKAEGLYYEEVVGLVASILAVHINKTTNKMPCLQWLKENNSIDEET